MAKMNNLNRPSQARSTTNMNPRLAFEDLDEKIRELSPDATPIQSFASIFGRGDAPKSKKVQVSQYDEFDHFDFCDRVVLAPTGSGLDRLARLRLTQPSRPQVNGVMYYYPQDKFWIRATGQVVEVVMTPVASILRDGVNPLTLRQDFVTGAGSAATQVSVTNQGEVMVRNTEPGPIIPFGNSEVIFMGRTIYESQRIQAVGAIRDITYDFNYVEHKEKVLVFTEDQKKAIQKGTFKDFDFQNKQMLKEFKRDVENTLMFGERALDMSVPGRPKHHMRGLYHAIQTNVAFYNPQSTVDFEKMFLNFLYQMAFRVNPGDTKSKLAIVGPDFLIRFNQAFRMYRRTSQLDVKEKSIGIDIEGYDLPGGYKVNFMRSDLLRQGTPMGNWCFIIDPSQAELRINKDYVSRPYAAPDERDYKVMVEWQGTVSWHLEQSHALLRTA